MAAFVKLDVSGVVYGKVRTLLDGSVQAVVCNWKPYLSELESLPVSLKDRCLYLMTKRGWLNDDNIAVLLHEKVQSLDLSDCDISDRGVVAIKRCSQLRKLDLNANKESRTSITSEAIQQIAENCTQLQTVYLRRCLNLTDDAIVTLSRRCPRLRLLNIGGCQQITDQSLEALGQNSNYLKSINLSNTKVTDVGLMRLASGQCGQSLTEIHINGCHGVTDEGVEAVLQFCPQISIFIFHGCPNITDFHEFTLCRPETLANSEDTDVTPFLHNMWHFIRVCTIFYKDKINLQRKIEQYFWEIKTCDPLIYTMDHPDLIVCSFMEKSIGLKRVNLEDDHKELLRDLNH